jgi:hypothetical protein
MLWLFIEKSQQLTNSSRSSFETDFSENEEKRDTNLVRILQAKHVVAVGFCCQLRNKRAVYYRFVVFRTQS